MNFKDRTGVGYTHFFINWDDGNIDGVTGADAPWYFGSTADYPLLSFDGQQPITQFDITCLLYTSPSPRD